MRSFATVFIIRLKPRNGPFLLAGFPGHSHIYMSAGPLQGAIRLRRVCCNQPVPSHSNHLNHKLTVKLSIHFSNFQSSSLQLSICQSGISFSAIWWSVDLLTVGHGPACYHHLGVFPQPGSPQGISEKSSNFKHVSKAFKNQKKSLQGHPKSSK